MNWQTHKKLLLMKPEFQVALNEIAPELQIAKMVIEARIKRHIAKTAQALNVSFKLHISP